MGLISPQFDADRHTVLAANDLSSPVNIDIRLGRRSSHNNMGHLAVEIELVDAITSGATDDHIDVLVKTLADGTNPSDAALHTYESWIPVGEITARRSFILSSLFPTYDPWAATPIHVPPVGYAFRLTISKDTGDRTHSLIAFARYINLLDVIG